MLDQKSARFDKFPQCKWEGKCRVMYPQRLAETDICFYCMNDQGCKGKENSRFKHLLPVEYDEYSRANIEKLNARKGHHDYHKCEG